LDHALLVLGLLKLQEMHGYQLSDLIDRRLKYLTDLKKPTLYHLLGKLEAAGDVTRHVSREGNRPERYTYKLAPQGRTHFHTLLRQNLKEAHTAYFEDDIGLLFLSELPAPEARAYLQQKRVQVAAEAEALGGVAAQHGAGTPAYYTLRHHELHLRTECAWLDELLGQLKKRAVRADIIECLEATEPAPSRRTDKVQTVSGSRRGIRTPGR
jgi:DNA-binding PadR family transcriptional regulator